MAQNTANISGVGGIGQDLKIKSDSVQGNLVIIHFLSKRLLDLIIESLQSRD